MLNAVFNFSVIVGIIMIDGLTGAINVFDEGTMRMAMFTGGEAANDA